MSVTALDPVLRQEVIDRFRHRDGSIHCARCEGRVVKGGFQIDHIVPEIDSTPEDRIDPLNLQVLCLPCHKKKTAAEATRHARQVRALARDWRAILSSASLAVVCAGVSVTSLTNWPVSPKVWLAACTVASATVLSTFLVKNAFGSRAPLETIPPAPERIEAPPTVDVDRITTAVREVVGARGEVSVTGATLAEFTVHYPATGFADHLDDKRWDLVEKITAKIGGRWQPFWDTTSDRVRLVRRPELPAKVPHPGLDPKRPWHVLPVAEGVAFDLLVTPHLLIVGETAAGKTSMLRCCVVAACDSAARHADVKTILVDPKRIEMMGFRGWPGVKRIVATPEDLWDIAFEIRDEMERRYALVEEGRAKPSDFEKWICIFDEFAEYFEVCFDLWTSGEKDANGDPYKKSGEKVPGPIRAIGRSLAMGRRLGIHLIISTQSPDSGIFGKSGVRQNMPGRATVGAIDAIRARMIFNDSSIGRDIPSSAKGRATIQIGDGIPQEIQTYWLVDPADADANGYKNTEEDWAVLARVGMPERTTE